MSHVVRPQCPGPRLARPSPGCLGIKAGAVRLYRLEDRDRGHKQDKGVKGRLKVREPWERFPIGELQVSCVSLSKGRPCQNTQGRDLELRYLAQSDKGLGHVLVC